MFRNAYAKRGFTLIELLVVIAIIGVISSVVMASLNSARGNARNASRISLVTQYSLALEQAYDNLNRYPVSSATYVCLGDYPGTSCWAGSYFENSTVHSEISPFISQLPIPPAEGIPYTGIVYHSCPGTYCSGTQVYQLHWFMEGANKTCGKGVVQSANWNNTDSTYCMLTVNQI